MLVILSGVSGAGKDTIKKELIKRMNDTTTLPSYTSRIIREGEEEGVQYHFITKEQFEDKIRQGDFYEYDLHHGNYYGTSRELMNEKINQGKIYCICTSSYHPYFAILGIQDMICVT